MLCYAATVPAIDVHKYLRIEDQREMGRIRSLWLRDQLKVPLPASADAQETLRHSTYAIKPRPHRHHTPHTQDFIVTKNIIV